MTNYQRICQALNAASVATGVPIVAIKSKSRKREIVAARVIYVNLLKQYKKLITLKEAGLEISLTHDMVLYYRGVFETKWYDPKTGTKGFKELYDSAFEIFNNNGVNSELLVQEMIAKIDLSLANYTPRQINKAYTKHHKKLELTSFLK